MSGTRTDRRRRWRAATPTATSTPTASASAAVAVIALALCLMMAAPTTITAATPPGVAGAAAPTDVAPFPTADAFVRQQFTDLHGRSATAAERATFGAELLAGSATAAQVIDTIAHLPGAADRTSAVTRLYLASFARNPDASGLSFWLGRSRTGTRLGTIASTFAASSEFAYRHGPLSNRAFVDLLYLNTFVRAGDDAGLRYWTSQLGLGRMSRGEVMVGFSESSEHRTTSRATTEVILLTAGMLRKVPSGEAWASDLTTYEVGGTIGLITDLLARPDYQVRFARPDAPGSVTAAGDDSSIDLRWSASSGNGLPVLGYRVLRYADGKLEGSTIPPTTKAHLFIAPLQNGVAYTFTVAARNANGYGPPSALTSPVTPGALAAWSGYQGNSHHDGNEAFASLPDAPDVAWTRTFDDTVSYPVLADGRVFVIVRSGPAGASGGRLYALDHATGATLWGPKTIGGPTFKTGLAYANGAVFTVDGHGTTTAWNAADGSVSWTRTFSSGYLFGGPPTTRNGLVYLVSGAQRTYALDQVTGEIEWDADAGDTHSSVAVTPTTAFVTSGCSATALDATTGAVTWTVPDTCNGVSGTVPVTAAGHLYVRPGAGDENQVQSAATGARLRAFEGSGTPAVADGAMFAVTDAGLTVTDAATGSVRWTNDLGGESATMPPVVSGGRAYVATEPGKVLAFDVATGAKVWEGQAGTGTSSSEEWNYDTPLIAMGIAEGHLVVPAEHLLVAFG